MDGPVTRYEKNPGEALADVFRAVHRERGGELPFVNPALDVEPCGFRLWRGHWIGALIAPWFLNVVIVPGPSEPWPSPGDGALVEWAFPSRTETFRASAEEPFGQFLVYSALPSVLHLTDQDAARHAARALLGVLFRPPDDVHTTPTQPPESGDTSRSVRTARTRVYTRRGFLSGKMFRD